MISEPIGQRLTLPIYLKITWFVLQTTTEGKYNSVNGTFCVSKDVTIVALRNVIKKYQDYGGLLSNQKNFIIKVIKVFPIIKVINVIKDLNC